MPGKLNESQLKFLLPKMIYPAITVLFAATVLFLFGKTIMFLSANIDKAFSESNPALTEQVPRFDQPDYVLIEKRFGWNTGTQGAVALPPPVNATSSTVAASSTAPQINASSSIIIKKNSAATSTPAKSKK